LFNRYRSEAQVKTLLATVSNAASHGFLIGAGDAFFASPAAARSRASFPTMTAHDLAWGLKVNRSWAGAMAAIKTTAKIKIQERVDRLFALPITKIKISRPRANVNVIRR
jgi:hypothetical protein